MNMNSETSTHIFGIINCNSVCLKSNDTNIKAQVMSLDLQTIIISCITAIITAVIPVIFTINKKAQLQSEDFEEIIKPDGSRIKKHKKLYK